MNIENALFFFTPIRVVTIAVNTDVLEPCSGRKPFLWPKLSGILRTAPSLARTSPQSMDLNERKKSALPFALQRVLAYVQKRNLYAVQKVRKANLSPADLGYPQQTRYPVLRWSNG